MGQTTKPAANTAVQEHMPPQVTKLSSSLHVSLWDQPGYGDQHRPHIACYVYVCVHASTRTRMLWLRRAIEHMPVAQLV
jgi:hypothetical protein